MNYSQIKTEVDSGQDEPPKITTWTEEETDTLNWYFAQATTVKDDPIEEISRQFKENGHREKSHQQIVDQLLSLGLVTEEEPVVAKYKRYSAEQALMQNEKQDLTHSTKDDVEFLAEKLLEEHPKMINWLQRVLLQCSFIKSRIDDGVRTNQELIVNFEGKHVDRIMEPTLLIYIRAFVVKFRRLWSEFNSFLLYFSEETVGAVDPLDQWSNGGLHKPTLCAAPAQVGFPFGSGHKEVIRTDSRILDS